MRELFRRFARVTSEAMGKPWAFALATLTVIVWAVTGPAFHLSDTWQLVINTGTTIITFLMVFLIQATQNRDATAIHLKLDELLRSVAKARNAFVGIEHMTEEEINEIEADFRKIRLRLAERRNVTRNDTG